MSVASTEKSWSRSRYPLHPSSQNSVPSSPTTSPSEHESVPSLAQLLERAPAPWYHAVTATDAQPSINNTASATDFSSLHLNGESEAMDRSSVAYSTSQQSTSPPSVAPAHPSHQEETVPVSHPETSQPLSEPWTQQSESHQAQADDVTSQEHSTHGQDTDFSPDQSPEQSPVQAPGRTRTLRRTPRNRRITSPVSVEDIKPPRGPSEDEGSTVVSISNPWKRQGYPLHTGTEDSPPQQQQSTPQPDQKDSSSTLTNGNQESEQSTDEVPSTESASWHRQLDYSTQTNGASAATPPATHTPQPEPNISNGDVATAAEPTGYPQGAAKPAIPNKALRRQAYPLQSPASVANLRRSPTPPQSASESEKVSPDPKPQQSRHAVEGAVAPPAPGPATGPAPAAKKKALRRQAYPLQTPASIANLRGEVTPPPSPGSQDDTDSDSTYKPHDSDPPSPSVKRFRRHAYPLQRALTQERIPKPQSKEISSQVPAQPSQAAAAQPAVSTSAASRNSNSQIYPLQAQPASSPPAQSQSSNNKSLAPPLEQVSKTVAETEADKSAREVVEATQQVQPSAPAQSAPFRQQRYPLQAPASQTNVNEQPADSAPSTSPPPAQLDMGARTLANDVHSKPENASQASAYPVQSAPTATVERQGADDLSRKGSREHKLAMKVVKKWRREIYPLQSPKGLQPFDRPSTPQPDDNRPELPKKISLPKNIRAVKDADDDKIKGRTIVVCLDGTGDKFDNDNSNIVHIVSALKKDDPHQVTYYQAGIGTYGDRGLTSGFEAAADMAVGSGLGLHVRDAYHFLMHSYKEGDKICIFGFSRGAYTARCLAGMIHKVGLLPPRNIQQIYFAYQFYTDTSAEGWVQSEQFKKTFSIDVNVYLLGCFDSVASVGFIPRQLPLSSTPTNKAHYFRHAMALDERRAKFKICRHQKAGWADEVKPDNKAEAALEDTAILAHEVLPNFAKQDDVPPGYHKPRRYNTNYHPNVTDEEYEQLKAREPAFETDVHEVWFAGAHADVGGGAVPNDERHKLAQIPLRWMIRQAFECNTGIIFKTKMLAEFGLDIHTLWPKYERLAAPLHAPPPSMLEKYQGELPPRHIRRDKLIPTDKHVNGEQVYDLIGHKDEDWTPELVEDFYDAMSPLNDQLIQAPSWWILEFLPVQYKVPLAPGEVETRTGMNWGQYRGVEDLVPNLHWTVRHRMQNTNYKIQARIAKHTNWKIVV